MKVLKFGANWCVGCVVMKPRFVEIEKENSWLKTEFCDSDKNPDMMEKWCVKDLPTFIFLDENGAEIERMQGVIKKDILIKKIQELRER